MVIFATVTPVLLWLLWLWRSYRLSHAWYLGADLIIGLNLVWIWLLTQTVFPNYIWLVLLTTVSVMIALVVLVLVREYDFLLSVYHHWVSVVVSLATTLWWLAAIVLHFLG